MFDTRFSYWLEGARPHTWANAFAPVIVGTGAAVHAGSFNMIAAVYAAVVSWLLIIGVNYANDAPAVTSPSPMTSTEAKEAVLVTSTGVVSG